ncbi:MAG TPA: O-antigen ligase family protein [Anaerolineae bacterium]|nr:O-antigen ligase family protein [Anaerolineae bacterium]
MSTLLRTLWPSDIQRFLRRAAIILACLGLSWGISQSSLLKAVPLLIMGAIGVSILIVLAFKLDWGVLLLLLVTLFLPVGFATGSQSPITISLALTAVLGLAWFVRMPVERKRVSLLPSPLNRPLLAFAAVAIVSLIWSNITRDPFVRVWESFPRAQLGALSTMVLSPVAALLITNQLKTAKHIRRFIGCFLVAGILGLIRSFGDLNLPFPNTRGLFPLWIITLTAGQALFNEKLSRRVRLFFLAIAAAWFIYQFGQGITWKSGWLPPLVALLGLSVLRSRALFAVALIAGMIFVFAKWDSLSRSFEEEQVESGNTRAAAWEINWQFTHEHLFLGMGPAGYAVYYMTYVPNQGMATHNNYIDVVAQTGVLGLAIFAWMLLAGGRAAWETTRRIRSRGFDYALAISLLCGYAGLIVAMALGDWFIPFAYTQGIAGYDYTVWGWMMIGLIMLLHHRYVIAGDEADAPAPSPALPASAEL